MLAAWACAAWAQPVTADSGDASTDFLLYESALIATHAGDVERATALLESLIRINPQFAGAWLDLAMLYCQTGKSDDARALLGRLQTALPEVAERVVELTPVILRSCERHVSWPAASFEVARGYNSNVNLGAIQREMVVGSDSAPLLLVLSPDTKPRGDSFTDFRGASFMPLGADNALYASLFARQYSTMHDYDESVTNLEWQHYWTSGPWQGSLSLGPKWIVLNNRLYDRTVQANVEMYSPLELAQGRAFFGLGVARINYPQATEFDVVSTVLRAGLLWREGLKIEAGWRWNEATNNRPGGNASGYQIVGRYDLSLPKDWRASMQGRYQDMRDRSIFFPGLFDLYRSQKTWSIITRVEHDLRNNWTAGLDFSASSQQDNIPIFSFKGYETRAWIRTTF